MADHQERRTSEGGATGESKKDSYGGGGRGRYGGGQFFLVTLHGDIHCLVCVTVDILISLTFAVDSL